MNVHDLVKKLAELHPRTARDLLVEAITADRFAKADPDPPDLIASVATGYQNPDPVAALGWAVRQVWDDPERTFTAQEEEGVIQALDRLNPVVALDLQVSATCRKLAEDQRSNSSYEAGPHEAGPHEAWTEETIEAMTVAANLLGNQ
jgi:hypothetical protein